MGRAAEYMILFWLVDNEVAGWCSRNPSISLWVQWVSTCSYNPPSGWELWFLKKNSKIYYNEHSLRRNEDFALLLYYDFFTAFPMFLYSLTSLISNCLHLPFETQGQSSRLKPFSYKQEIAYTWRFLYPRGPHSILFSFKFKLKKLSEWSVLQPTHSFTNSLDIVHQTFGSMLELYPWMQIVPSHSLQCMKKNRCVRMPLTEQWRGDVKQKEQVSWSELEGFRTRDGGVRIISSVKKIFLGMVSAELGFG